MPSRPQPSTEVSPLERVSEHFILADFPESWAPIKGYGGRYEVSSLGRVVRVVHNSRGHTRSTLAGWIDEHGRQKVTLRHLNGGCKQRTVSTLVAAAFLGPRPDGLDVCHKDGKAHRNRASNLYYGTKEQNMADKLRHGTQPLGEKSHFAKRTEAQAREVKRLIAAGERNAEIGKQLCVPRGWVSDIRREVSWKWLTL